MIHNNLIRISAKEYKQIADNYINSLDAKHAKIMKYVEESLDIYLHNIYGLSLSAGELEWPVLKPNYTILAKVPLVPFNEAFSYGNTDCIVHFFIDDRLFMRVFRNLDKYIPFLQKCIGVIGPDVSQFTDMPEEMRCLHAFGNASLSLCLQKEGVNLYPNVTCSLPDSYCYSFQTSMAQSVIAINSNGVHRNALSLYRWRRGYEQVLKFLSPKHIIRYGSFVEGELASISSYYCNERLSLLKYGCKRK